MGVYKKELLKLIKHPSIKIGISLYVVFIIYCYVNGGLQYQRTFNSFIENGSFSIQQILEYIATADFSDPLRSQLNIVRPSSAFGYSLAIVNSLGPMFIAIIGAFLFGIEYRHLTIKQLWSSGMTRIGIVMGKVFSLATVIVLFISICIVTGYIMSFITPRIFDMPIDILSKEQIKLELSLFQFFGTFVSLLLWGVFAAFITVITKSLLVGIIVGFLYPILESSFLHAWSFSQYLPLFIQKSMLPILFGNSSYGGMVSYHSMPIIYSLEQSIFYTLVYIILFTIILLFVLKKQRVPML